MVLVCPGISGYPWPAEPELHAEKDALTQAGDLDGLIAAGLRVWAAAGADQAARDQLCSAARAWPNEETYLRPGPPAFDRLGQVYVATVVMVGDLDRPALISCNEEVARRIPGAELIRMAGVDHLPPLRCPDLIVETALRHFAGVGW